MYRPTKRHLLLNKVAIPGLLILSNDDHHVDTEEQGGDLGNCLLEGGTLQKFRQHTHCGYVDESTKI